MCLTFEIKTRTSESFVHVNVYELRVNDMLAIFVKDMKLYVKHKYNYKDLI